MAYSARVRRERALRAPRRSPMRCSGSSVHTSPVSSRRFTKCSLVTRLTMSGNGWVSLMRESQPRHTAVTITLFATGKWQSGAHFGRPDEDAIGSNGIVEDGYLAADGYERN